MANTPGRWRAGGTHFLQQAYHVSIRALANNFWGVTAIILVIFSVWLVTLVSFVGSSTDLDRATLSFAISTIDTDSFRPILEIEGRGDELFARIWVPLPKSVKSEIKLSHLKQTSFRGTWGEQKKQDAYKPCRVESEQGPNRYSISYGIPDQLSTTIHLNRRDPDLNQENFYRIIVEKKAPVITDEAGTPDGVEILCDLDIRPFRETFADRKLLISERGGPPPNDNNGADGVEVSLENLDGVSDLHLFSETPDSSTPEEDRLIKTTYGQVLAEWRDTQRVEFRDAILVLVGSLLGLAAACVIELVRGWLSHRRGQAPSE